MSAIGKGDWVLLVRTGPYPERFGMRHNGVYCVDSLDPVLSDCGLCGGVSDVSIQLVGITPPPGCGFCTCQLKPLGGNARAETRQAPAELEPA